MRRIAVYGGSFNPFSNNHFEILRWLAESEQFDAIFVVPSAHHALKDPTEMAPYENRLAMTKLGVTAAHYAMPSFPRNCSIMVSDIEQRLLESQEPPIYTYDLLKAVRDQQLQLFPNQETSIKFAIGPDIPEQFSEWKFVDEIRREFGFIEVPVQPMRATLVRKMIREGVNAWKTHMPRGVAQYITEQQLYQEAA